MARPSLLTAKGQAQLKLMLDFCAVSERLARCPYDPGCDLLDIDELGGPLLALGFVKRKGKVCREGYVAPHFWLTDDGLSHVARTVRPTGLQRQLVGATR